MVIKLIEFGIINQRKKSLKCWEIPTDLPTLFGLQSLPNLPLENTEKLHDSICKTKDNSQMKFSDLGISNKSKDFHPAQDFYKQKQPCTSSKRNEAEKVS